MNPLAYVRAIAAAAASGLSEGAFADRCEARERRDRPGGLGKYGDSPYAYARDERHRGRRPAITREDLKEIRYYHGVRCEIQRGLDASKKRNFRDGLSRAQLNKARVAA